MKINKLVSMLVSAICVLQLCGCADEEKEEKAVEVQTETVAVTEAETTEMTDAPTEAETTAAVETEASEEAAEDDNNGMYLKRVGDEKTGYVDLTQGDWVKFVEAESMEGTGILSMQQACTPSQSAIITLTVYEENNLSVEDVANNVWAACEADGGVDVTGATQTIGSYEAKQVYCYYEDIQKFLVSWVFKCEDNLIHFVSAEFTQDNAYAFDLCTSFSMT